MADLQAIMDHEIPHYYLANHLYSSPLDFNSNHMLGTLWILGLFLGIVMKSCACVRACVWAKFNNNTGEKYSSLSIILPSCTCRYNQLTLLSQQCGKVSTLHTNFSKEHLPSHCTLVQAWFMDSSMPYRVRVRNNLFNKTSVWQTLCAASSFAAGNFQYGKRGNFDLGKQWNGKHSQWHFHQRWCNGVARATLYCTYMIHTLSYSYIRLPRWNKNMNISQSLCD